MTTMIGRFRMVRGVSFIAAASIALGWGVLACLPAGPALAEGEAQAASPPTPPGAPAQAPGEPGHITVQHVLIGFKGSVPGKDIARTQEEARTLAYAILERARKGESFIGLVKQYTDDSAPGIYSMANTNVPPGQGEHRRAGMVRAFGDVSFGLEVGEFGIADFDPQASPYGWHVVKRLK
jgi:hypothetical protein